MYSVYIVYSVCINIVYSVYVVYCVRINIVYSAYIVCIFMTIRNSNNNKNKIKTFKNMLYTPSNYKVLDRI